LEDGICTDRFSTRCALRIRVNMSAMGSFMLMDENPFLSSF
jgi:hypothetical protein